MVNNNAGIIENPGHIKQYLDGPAPIFTLVSRKTGKRYTYRAAHGDFGLMVSNLSGPDNKNDYSYLGLQTERGFKPKANTLVPPAGLAIAWFLGRLYSGGDLDQVDFWHTGICTCGRRLTTPESVARGLGPICAARAAARAAAGGGR